MTADHITLTPSKPRGTTCAVAGSPQDIKPDQSARTHLPFAISPPLGVAAGQSLHVVSRSGVRLEIHDLPEIAREWKAFEYRADHLAFQSFDWLANWQRHVRTRRGTSTAAAAGGGADE